MNVSLALRWGLVAWVGLGIGCASESHRAIEPAKSESAMTVYSGPKVSVSVGKFENTSPYLNALFSDGEDRIGNQAKTILQTHLTQSQRFVLLDRENMSELEQEARLAGTEQSLAGARYVLTGQVTEFGRKTTGDEQLFGVLGRGKEQTAYSKVSLSVVDVRTGAVVYSVQGAGEYALSDREVIGFGSTAGYDSTLNGKVLNLSITEAVDRLATGFEQGAWGRDDA